ncbi:MAG TPA: His/Gly/Thr/Pro-type tRNA ligase C-terminal domain-containing protein, partial [Aggregatilineales bacterium]|nr:His/Gly/Thr/Pro-type tRNA ligase C-terminal domain-containing protein [Aggregatilineales bacterium]
EDTPGFKFNDWEMRGVPIRLEVGPKDVQNNKAVLARRDMGKEGKQFISQEGIVAQVTDLLNAIHDNMLAQATAFRDANIYDISTYDDFKVLAEKGGWARVWWAGSNDDERKVKEETGATLRCFPLDQPGGSGTCVYTGKPANRVAIFSKAY